MERQGRDEEPFQMTYRLSLSWTSPRRGGGGLDDPMWSDVETHLVDIKQDAGSVTLNMIGEPESGPCLLQVLSSPNSEFVIMLGEIIDEEYEVRSYFNRNAIGEKVEIGGNYWDSRTICRNFNDVFNIFAVFFERLNVPDEMLKRPLE